MGKSLTIFNSSKTVQKKRDLYLSTQKFCLHSWQNNDSNHEVSFN
jgi:hypothetical protein